MTNTQTYNFSVAKCFGLINSKHLVTREKIYKWCLVEEMSLNFQWANLKQPKTLACWAQSVKQHYDKLEKQSVKRSNGLE
jgi:hypothetical protein